MGYCEEIRETLSDQLILLEPPFLLLLITEKEKHLVIISVYKSAKREVKPA